MTMGYEVPLVFYHKQKFLASFSMAFSALGASFPFRFILRVLIDPIFSDLEIAKNLLRSKRSALSLDDRAIEEICLTSSREFYDNASSGNCNFGDMKLAYDWCVECPLAFVCLPTPSVACRFHHVQKQSFTNKNSSRQPLASHHSM